MKRPRRKRAPDSGQDRQRAPLELLGLARRAGAVEAGVDAARRAVRTGRAKLLLTAADASPTQLEKVAPGARRAGVPIRELATRIRLGEAVGRPPLAAVAVTDKGLAEQVLLRISDAGTVGDVSM
ncbi:MAG: ribosomal L7Ae/L30e/S12e/Gadd45 family protein [Gemmatimonadota bacterium]|jgi:ribosomal protein L7Ae-like RNA K-turn-binding protein